MGPNPGLPAAQNFVLKTKNGIDGCHAILISPDLAITLDYERCDSKSLFSYSKDKNLMVIEIDSKTPIIGKGPRSNKLRHFRILRLKTNVEGVNIPEIAYSPSEKYSIMTYAYRSSDRTYHSGHPFTARPKNIHFRLGEGGGDPVVEFGNTTLLTCMNSGHIIGAPILSRDGKLTGIITNEYRRIERLGMYNGMYDYGDFKDFWSPKKAFEFSQDPPLVRGLKSVVFKGKGLLKENTTKKIGDLSINYNTKLGSLQIGLGKDNLFSFKLDREKNGPDIFYQDEDINLYEFWFPNENDPVKADSKDIASMVSNFLEKAAATKGIDPKIKNYLLEIKGGLSSYFSKQIKL